MDDRLKELSRIAYRIRIEVLKSVYTAGSGHIGGSFSAAEIMSLLFFDKMNIFPLKPEFADRDRFILSKGHVAPVLYAALALRGFFPVQELATLRKMDSRLPGHPAYKKTPGVDMVSGSLGQGLSVGVGIRLAARHQGKDFRTFVLLGDGEIQEGSVWESAMAAAHFKINNLIAILDYNRVQLDGTVGEIMEVSPVADKWRSFGWKVIECDGHNVEALDSAFDLAIETAKSGPVIIIGSTVKGKGVSFMENKAAWHGACPSSTEYECAFKELNDKLGCMS